MCLEDYVRVYAMRNYSVRPRQLSQFCGTSRERVFAELGGLRVRFVSDQQFTNRGFVANFFISRQSRSFLVSA